jgi:ankyrin repeat protein
MNDEVRLILDKVGNTATFLFHRVDAVTQRNALGDTPLHVVVSWGDARAAKALINAGADINSKGEFGNTPLHEAVLFGGAGMVEILLEHGASSNLQNDDGRTPPELVDDTEIEKLFQAER